MAGNFNNNNIMKHLFNFSVVAFNALNDTAAINDQIRLFDLNNKRHKREEWLQKLEKRISIGIGIGSIVISVKFAEPEKVAKEVYTVFESQCDSQLLGKCEIKSPFNTTNRCDTVEELTEELRLRGARLTIKHTDLPAIAAVGLLLPTDFAHLDPEKISRILLGLRGCTGIATFDFHKKDSQVKNTGNTVGLATTDWWETSIIIDGPSVDLYDRLVRVAGQPSTFVPYISDARRKEILGETKKDVLLDANNVKFDANVHKTAPNGQGVHVPVVENGLFVAK